MKTLVALILFTFSCFGIIAQENEMILKDNLKRAQLGDFIVTAQNKTYTMLLVREKNDKELTFEEITVPASRKPQGMSWREWIHKGASGHTGWIMYQVSLESGLVTNVFSFNKNEWVSIPKTQNILSTLLNLRLKLVSLQDRKKIGLRPFNGSKESRALWQPRMVVDGQTIQGVSFEAWRTRWPKDGSELAGKNIEVYVPLENDKYPSYFPYWLQISGMVGKAQIRIVDSGTTLFTKVPS